MKTLVMLYLIYLSWGTVGQGRVSFLEMSRCLRRSKTQTKNDLLKLAQDGLVDVITLYSDAGAKKYFVQLSDMGDAYLMQNFDATQLQYHEHVAMIIAEVKASQSEYQPARMTKKQLAAIASGKMEMEGFE